MVLVEDVGYYGSFWECYFSLHLEMECEDQIKT